MIKQKKILIALFFVVCSVFLSSFVFAEQCTGGYLGIGVQCHAVNDDCANNYEFDDINLRYQNCVQGPEACTGGAACTPLPCPDMDGDTFDTEPAGGGLLLGCSEDGKPIDCDDEEFFVNP